MKFIDLHSEQREDLNKTGIYIIYHTSKQDWYYIGSAAKTNKKNYNDIGFLQRWRNHLGTLKRQVHFNPILQRVVNKYGIGGIRFKIIEFCKSEDCINVENKWIKYYIDNYNVYNINKIHPSKLGYITSQETKDKISNSRKTKTVYQYSLEGVLIKEWKCLNKVTEIIPSANSTVWKCLNGYQNTSHGFKWSYNKE